jgi:DNA polymerase V
MPEKKVTLQLFAVDQTQERALPLVNGGISAGFPSPAQDHLDLKLDLNKELIANPLSTFFGRVSGQSMKDAGILDGDLLVIDKSLDPNNGDIAVCFLDGEFTLKRLRMEADAVYLDPANPQYPSLKVTEDNHFCIWGIVTYTIRDHRHRRRQP